jgi:prepilin-type N-terminal cleavage/methylation domain-containing protein
MFTHQIKRKNCQFFAGSKRGLTLIEVAISMLVGAIIISSYLTAVRGAITTLISVDEKETAKTLAESQMEYVKTHSFALSYDPDTIPAAYHDYEVSISVGDIDDRDGNIQMITIIIERRDSEIMRLVGFKVK